MTIGHVVRWWRTRSERIEADIEDGQIYKQHNLPQTLTATEMFPCSPSCLSLGNSTKQQNVKIKNRKECRKVQRLGKNALVSLGVRERYISRVRLAAREMAISFGWTCVRLTRTHNRPRPLSTQKADEQFVLRAFALGIIYSAFFACCCCRRTRAG